MRGKRPGILGSERSALYGNLKKREQKEDERLIQTDQVKREIWGMQDLEPA